VNIIDDTIDEFDEIFLVTLSNVKNAKLENSMTTVTIQDDDPLPQLSISSYISQPGERAKINVSIDRESEKGVSFEYSTNQSGSALATTDFQTIANQLVLIPDNTTSVDVEVKTIFRGVNQPSRDFSVIISNQTESTIVAGTANVDITVPNEGSLDKAFSEDGVQTTATSGSYDRAKAILPLANGFVYVLNHSQAQGSIHRYTDEGTLDTSFNTVGIKNINVFSGYNSITNGVASSDNSLIAISSSRNSEDSFDVLMLSADGSYDISFNGTGFKEIGLGGYTGGKAEAIAITSNGKILIGGYIYNTDKNIYLVQLNMDGTIDTNFGVGGIVTQDLNGAGLDDTIHDIKINVDGTFYIGGVRMSGTIGNAFVAKFHENGNLDNSFNGNGVFDSSLTIDYTNRSIITSINVLADESVIFTVPNKETNRLHKCQIQKILADGTIDTTFGDFGFYTTVPNTNINGCRKTLEDKSHNLVVYAEFGSSGFPDAVFVLSPNGALDTSFNGGSGFQYGMTNTAQGTQFRRGFSLSAKGKIILAGGFNDVQVTKLWYSDENIPEIIVNDILVPEGTGPHYLTYSLSHRVEFPFRINYSLSDGSATLTNNDYDAITSTGIEGAGRIGARMAITVNDDSDNELDETVNLTISSTATDINITDNSGILTIQNDD
jgi:uncharacterized delta-60 repeat protein